MSGFIGGQGGVASSPGQHGWLAKSCIRALAREYRWPNFWLEVDEPWRPHWYVTDWWPQRSRLDATGDETLSWARGAEVEHNTGAIAKRGFSGYTRDINGVIIGGATVRLFRTSDGLMTCQVVSGSDGFFTLDTQFYPDTHFYTAHKADVPEIAGASPSTLVPG